MTPAHSSGAASQILEPGGQGNREVRARHRVLRVTAVHGVSGEDRRIAQVLLAAPAVLAGPVDAGHPGHPEARACRNPRLSPDNLVAWNHVIAQGLQLAFDDVKIGAAHPASQNAQQDLARRGSGDAGVRGFRAGGKRCSRDGLELPLSYQSPIIADQSPRRFFLISVMTLETSSLASVMHLSIN